MPLTLDSRKKDTLDPDRLVVAWQSFFGPAGSVHEGDELRASDPRVRQAVVNFCELDVPKDERPTALDHSFEVSKQQAAAVEAERAAAFEKQARGNRIRLAAPPMFKSTRDLVTYRGGAALVERGSIVLEGDPLLVEFPDAFKSA
jgi:hypothetical protein